MSIKNFFKKGLTVEFLQYLTAFYSQLIIDWTMPQSRYPAPEIVARKPARHKTPDPAFWPRD
ncbi:MAG TPA: hypothetical protein VL754_10320 [Verrucomicrobiae bacterium]|jgi:hypothetical protein|nr:hypothetical protein [Verrucomicrobiae bacterium]